MTQQNDGRVRTGVAGLDDILGGGLPANHLYLLEGDPGTGKTTLAMQFLLEGVRQGESGLYITLSESKHELEEVARSHGWSLDGISIYELTPVEDLLSSEAQYTVFHPSEVELADLVTSILQQVSKIRPRRVVVDALSEIKMLARDPLRYRRQIIGLKRFFSGRESTALLLDEHITGDNDRQLQSIAHGVIIIQSTDRLYGVKRRRLEIRKLRGSSYREGFHDMSIKTGGLQVYPRLIAAEHRPGFDHACISSGIAELDALLGGGIDRGTSNLLMGPAGCGKSTVAARYAFSATERGEAAAIFCFDESTETLLYRCRGLNMDLQPYIDSGNLTVQQINPTELSPGEFAARVRDQVDGRGARVVIMDSLNGFLNAMPDEKYLTLQIHELLSYLGQQGAVTILTLAQHGIMGTSINSPVDISYLADTVVLFRYFEFEGHIKQAISVVKKGSGMHERTIRELEFNQAGLRVGPALIEFQGVLTGVPQFTGDRRDLESEDQAYG